MTLIMKDYKEYIETFKQIVDDASHSLEIKNPENQLKEYLRLNNSIKSQFKRLFGLKKHLFIVSNFVFKKFFEIVGVGSALVNEYLAKPVKKESDALVLKFLVEKHVRLEKVLHSFVINSESVEERNIFLKLNLRNEEFYNKIEVELSHPGFDHKYQIILSRLMEKTSIPVFKAWLLISNNYNAFESSLTDYQLEKNLERIIPEKSSELTYLLKRARDYTKKLVKSYNGSVNIIDKHKTYFI